MFWFWVVKRLDFAIAYVYVNGLFFVNIAPWTGEKGGDGNDFSADNGVNDVIFAKPDPVIIVSLTFNFFDVHAFCVLNEQQLFDGFSYCARTSS